MSRGQAAVPVTPPGAAAAVQPSELNVPVSGLSLDPEEQIIWKVFTIFKAICWKGVQFYTFMCLAFYLCSTPPKYPAGSATISNCIALREAKEHIYGVVVTT